MGVRTGYAHACKGLKLISRVEVLRRLRAFGPIAYVTQNHRILMTQWDS